MSLLDVALECAGRGWYVFPCYPRSKRRMFRGSWESASTNDEATVREWWTKWPDANVAIVCHLSGLVVLDCDHGNATQEDLFEFMRRFPATYSVKTGRRTDAQGNPEFGVQMYFTGTDVKTFPWALDNRSGEVRSRGAYVMAAGSIHPDSGCSYEVLISGQCSPVAASVLKLPPATPLIRSGASNASVVDDGGPVETHRNLTMISLLGRKRNEGADDEELREFAIMVNEARFVPPLEDAELERLIENACKFKIPEPEPGEILIGGKTAPEPPKPSSHEKVFNDWRDMFHTREEMDNAPPISFLIEGFLQREGVTAIAAPVRERKSMIAINIVHALLTGEKLFDHFEVTKKPERVLYFVPEVSLGPWTDRLKRIGLMEYVGKTLFCRTLSSEGHVRLDDPLLLPALPGSVVFLDTAIRFLEGDENSSKDIRSFADCIFALLRNGAESVVMLHHSPKDSGDVMTLENAMRGSGDMGAFLASCWGTKLQDPTDPYKSPSFMTNLKQRDFESDDFEATCDEDCRMHMIGEPGEVRLASRTGFKGNKDGKDDAAMAIMEAHPKMSSRELSKYLATQGVRRGKDWVQQYRPRNGATSEETD